MRLDWSVLGVAVCSLPGLQGQGHWKATVAREFSKRKALDALSTASRGISRTAKDYATIL